MYYQMGLVRSTIILLGGNGFCSILFDNVTNLLAEDSNSNTYFNCWFIRTKIDKKKKKEPNR